MGMDLAGVAKGINIAIRAAFVVLGILLILGVYGLRNIAPQFRILLGVVFILYGIFRMVTLLNRNKGGRDE